jgi:acetyl-CoA carboxylase biotin carboxyl carrier protein
VGLSYDEIAEILKIIDASSCDEVIVETPDVKLVVRRNGPAGATGTEAPPRQAAAPPPVADSAPQDVSPRPPPETVAPAPAAEIAPHQVAVTAPMVGTFYRARAPDAPPFVEIGSSVRKGEPLCLIEVMKLFTTITAEHDGRVVQIGAVNGELVEYGRTLFVIDPN